MSRQPWVQRPWLDLLVGGGGWSAPLLLASYALAEADAQRWAAVFYPLALVCNYPHYMATLHRAYGLLEDRTRYRLFTHYLTALLVLVGLAAHVRPAILPWLFTLYVMWSPWHYTGQNFGLSMMFLRRAGVDLSPRDRQWLHRAFVASYVMLLAAFNQGPSADRVVLSLGLPFDVAWPIQIVAGIVFAAGGAHVYRSLARRVGWRTIVAPLTLFSTQALWFVVPIAVSWVSAAPGPQTRYSSGVLAVMHSAQYLWITQHYARRDASRLGDTGWSARRYWLALVFGGAVLFVPVPWLASYGAHVDFTSSALIVAAIVNIHHFLIDGIVWKLRDPRVAQALVGHEPARTPAAQQPVHETTLRWHRRPAIRVAAVTVVALVALLDQWRYLLAVDRSDLAALTLARTLNPHDSGVHLRVAAAATAGGDREAAGQALAQAIAANPDDPAPYHALARFLIESGRLTEAYAHCQTLLARWPDDVDTLVNAGVLAERLGDTAAAERWWTRAVARDPSAQPVRLYLAELLHRLHRPADALPHYRQYLEQAAAQRDDPPSPRDVALVVLKFGDALERTGQTATAATQYKLALRIARQTGLTDVEALARERTGTARP